HSEPRLRIVPPPSGKPRKAKIVPMLFMDEATADCARPAVEIFVIAPDSEIRPPIMQIKHYITNRMGQVEPDNAALLLGTLDKPGITGMAKHVPGKIINSA